MELWKWSPVDSGAISMVVSLVVKARIAIAAVTACVNRKASVNP